MRDKQKNKSEKREIGHLEKGKIQKECLNLHFGCKRSAFYTRLQKARHTHQQRKQLRIPNEKKGIIKIYRLMYRTHTCGELRLSDAGNVVTLAGWVQRVRKMGGMTFVDMRDRYGITQIVFNQETDKALFDASNDLGREYVIQVTGKVNERYSKNANLPTGEIEIIASELKVLNRSELPPFTIEDNTDGGDDIRMKYRYLDLRRPTVRKNLELRHRMCIAVRNYLSKEGFLEIETPILVGSTPEGARDFLVPSRMNQGQFYALPQSPQTLKQLLMVAGIDRYFQIAKCFRDEDLRADRQPEFTQIDCEMSFVTQEDIIQTFEGMTKYLFKEVRGVELDGPFLRLPWIECMKRFGSDKPDMRFGMEFVELMDVLKGTGEFAVFNDAAYIGGICVPGCAVYTRKQIDQLTDWVKRPQIGAKGMVYARVQDDGSVKSSVDKFYTPEVLDNLKNAMGAKAGDLILICSGKKEVVWASLGFLRRDLANKLGMLDPHEYKLLWVVDFPMFEWSDEENRYMAMHHPFTSPKKEDIHYLETGELDKIYADAYDIVINGYEAGGGSIRIHDSKLQKKIFEVLQLTEEDIRIKVGFFIDAFKYGAPPHGGLAFGLDRLCMLLLGTDDIRQVIAFPKNQNAQCVMSEAPTIVTDQQLEELSIAVRLPEGK